jgi:hypothetical protein
MKVAKVISYVIKIIKIKKNKNKIEFKFNLFYFINFTN